MNPPLGGDGVETHAAVLRMTNHLKVVAFDGFIYRDGGHGDESASFRGHDLCEREVFAFRHHARLDALLAKPDFQRPAQHGVLRRQERGRAMQRTGKILFQLRGQLFLGAKG